MFKKQVNVNHNLFYVLLFLNSFFTLLFCVSLPKVVWISIKWINRKMETMHTQKIKFKSRYEMHNM